MSLAAERHANRILSTRHFVSSQVETLQAERVDAVLQRDSHYPTLRAGPLDRVFHAVDLDCFDRYRSCAGQDGQIVPAGKLVSRIGGDFKICVFSVQLAQQIASSGSNPAFRSAGTGGGYSVGAKSAVHRVQHGTAGLGGKRPVHGILPGPQISPAKSGMVIHSADSGVVDLKHRMRGAVAAAAQRKIQIPQDHLPLSILGFVGGHVFAAVIAVAVPISHNVPHGEDAHPLFDVYN